MESVKKVLFDREGDKAVHSRKVTNDCEVAEYLEVEHHGHTGCQMFSYLYCQGYLAGILHDLGLTSSMLENLTNEVRELEEIAKATRE